MKPPSEEEQKHLHYRCLMCDSGPYCFECHPPKFISKIRRNPDCNCGKACLCRKSSQICFYTYACSEVCYKFLKKYVVNPWAYEKQNFKLQIIKMENNWDVPHLSIRRSEHSYDLTNEQTILDHSNIFDDDEVDC